MSPIFFVWVIFTVKDKNTPQSVIMEAKDSHVCGAVHNPLAGCRQGCASRVALGVPA